MSRETKQDRIVRNNYDSVSEHLHELKNLEANPATKESDIERWAQSFLKTCLGYSSSSGYFIKPQDIKGKMRPDLVTQKNDKSLFVIEVKKLGYDLDKSDFRSGKVQLSEYLKTYSDVKFGILTNGFEWKLYDFSDTNYPGIEIKCFDLRTDDIIDFSKRNIEDKCWEIMDFHESTYNSEGWNELSKEAMAFSPESLAKAILSIDVVKYIAKSIRGEHDYRADNEMLVDKIYSLLEDGLDDSVKGWNEIKAAEFQKYIKAQKRLSKKSKKEKKEVVQSEAPVVMDAIITNETPSNETKVA